MGSTSVFEFIEGWYNPHRLHSSLDYDSPVHFERKPRLEERIGVGDFAEGPESEIRGRSSAGPRLFTAS